MKRPIQPVSSAFTNVVFCLAVRMGLAMVLLTGFVAGAATLYWDGGTTDILANGNGSSGGGSGTWNTTITNWDGGSGVPHVVWNNSNSDSATFAGTAGTVTLGSNIEIRISLNEALNFTVGNYTIAGNSYTIKTLANTGITANNNTFDAGLTLDTSTYTLTLGEAARPPTPGLPGPGSYGNGVGESGESPTPPTITPAAPICMPARCSSEPGRWGAGLSLLPKPAGSCSGTRVTLRTFPPGSGSMPVSLPAWTWERTTSALPIASARRAAEASVPVA
jgi:hypothetical protein